MASYLMIDKVPNEIIISVIYFISLQGRSSMCGSKSCWSVTHHHQKDMPERRSSAPPPLNANVLRVRKFSYGFDLDSHINVTCACLNYAKACFGFCKKSRRYSEQVIIQIFLQLLVKGSLRNV